jgi:hypothetical protein
LRMGIETRLHEYLSVATSKKVKDYDAKKLMMKLRERRPHAQKSFTLTFTPVPGGTPSSFSYTGISDDLVDAHGRLGELLHATFFRNNPDWPYRMPLRDKTPPSRSLTDVRDWLGRVADELEKATQGALLGVGGSMFEGLFDDKQE